MGAKQQRYMILVGVHKRGDLRAKLPLTANLSL